MIRCSTIWFPPLIVRISASRDAAFRILQARAQLGVAFGTLFPQTQTMNGDYQRFAATRNTANRSFIAKRFYDQWDYGFTTAHGVEKEVHHQANFG